MNNHGVFFNYYYMSYHEGLLILKVRQ